MQLNRLRIVALGTSAVLVLAGASAALAQGPQQVAPGAAGTAVENPGTVPDTDNIQSGDQTGVDETGADSNQTGGQTTADSGARAAVTSESSASNKAGAAQRATKAESAANAEANSDSSTESESNNESESQDETDGPGGHADPAGQNVDHQFEGQE